MKSNNLLLFLMIFFSFTGCLNPFPSENEGEYTIQLKDEMNRAQYTIKYNETKKFINSNNNYIYFIESFDNNAILEDENNKKIKDIAYLQNLNSFIIAKHKNESEKESIIYVTSILNDIGLFSLDLSDTFHHKQDLTKSQIGIFRISESQDYILNFDAWEKSFLFYYCKYDFNTTNPKDFFPINRKLFNKLDQGILELKNSSTYIIIMELYRFDTFLKIFELFISPKQINKEILINNNNKLYLKESEEYYNINFTESKFQRILKISKATKNCEIVGNKNEKILDSKNSYYELTEANIKNGIKLKVKKDCLIDILFSSINNTEIIDAYSIENHKLTKPYTIIKQPKIKSIYEFKFYSENKKNLSEFNFGINYQISKNSYFYNWLDLHITFKSSYYDLTLISPYLYQNETEDNEYQIFEIILDQQQLENDIYLTYNPHSYYKFLYEKIDNESSSYIIGNISNLIENYYIYKDIAKKPPEIENLPNYHHKPIDIIKDLNNIPKNNRTHLGLYIDIFNTVKFVRDGHLNMKLNNIENKINLVNTGICLPFEFYIDTININGEIVPKLKMRAYNQCLNVHRDKEMILKFINSHINIAIKSINGTDPFDFIQNFGRIQRYHSRHAQFTENLVMVKHFNILDLPYDLSELIDIEYEFENGDIIKQDYQIVTTSGFTDINQKEFEEFHLSNVNNQTNNILIPNIFESLILYKKKKRLLFAEEFSQNNEIVWNYQTNDGKLKCREDKTNQINFFVQTSFSFSSTENAIDVMIDCANLFYSNNYKIIGIENYNGGGAPILYQFWHQLLQQKTFDRTFRAIIRNEITYDILTKTNIHSTFVNPNTCKYISALNELGEKTDNYGFSEKFGEDIKHNRSGIYEFLERSWRKRIELIRKNNYEKNKQNLKKSTDILIYTDGFCFSSCSGFIRAFQDTGSAIIVGFNGNPKINGTNEFDGSQSSSTFVTFSGQESKNLEKLGYKFGGLTFSESFDESWQTENPIPRDYTVKLVDRRIPIYGPYTDDLYESFISHAKTIFEEFNKKCNKNNKKLVLEDENCQLGSHQKGGHPCGDNEEWNLNECQAYYCDFGYYYDPYKKECLLDNCNQIENDTNFLVNETYINGKEFKVEPNKELIFNFEDDNYYYFFEGTDNIISISDYKDFNLKKSVDFFMLEFSKLDLYDYQIIVNYFKNMLKETNVKVTTIKKVPNISIMSNPYSNTFSSQRYLTNLVQNQQIRSFKSTQDHILYFSSFNKDFNIYFSEYNYDLSPQDIININPQIFNISSNKIIQMKKDQSIVIIYKFPNDLINYYQFAFKKNMDTDINISNNKYLYLTQQNFDYTLHFASNQKIYFKLSKETSDAEIEFLDEKNIKLNKYNIYYLFNNNTNKLSLRLKNNNPALIELLYEYNGFVTLDINKNDHNLDKGIYLLRYQDFEAIKSIKINLESNVGISGFIHSTIGKDNFIGPIPNELNYNKKALVTEFIIPDEKLSDNEAFDILIKVNDNTNLKIELTKENEPNNNGKKEFPVWVIIVILVVGLIITMLIIFVIIRKTKRGKLDEKSIEETKYLLQNNE